MKHKTTIGQKLLIAILLITLIAASVLGLYAWSKYVTSLPGQTTAKVAKWNFNFKLKDGTENAEETVGPINLADTINFEHVKSGTIAPGTSGQFEMVVDTRGTEVSLIYEIEIKLTNCPTNLNFYKALGTDSAYLESNKISKEGNKLTFKEYVSKETAFNMQKTITVYWNWPYQTLDENGSPDKGDEQDKLFNGETISMEITATGTEVLNGPSYAKDKIPDVGKTNEKIYVKYESAQGPITCVVLYNDETHGLQIITADTINGVEIPLGKGDTKVEGASNLEKAQNSYNRAIQTLNEYAEEYIDDKGIATDSRCVGSVATAANGELKNKNDEEFLKKPDDQYEYTHLENYIEQKYKGTDENYLEDFTRIGNLGIENTSEGYWLASRIVTSTSTFSSFIVRTVSSNGNLYLLNYLFYHSSGTSNSTYGLRPVFLLNPNVEITEGDGKKPDTAYVLGLN